MVSIVGSTAVAAGAEEWPRLWWESLDPQQGLDKQWALSEVSSLGGGGGGCRRCVWGVQCRGGGCVWGGVRGWGGGVQGLGVLGGAGCRGGELVVFKTFWLGHMAGLLAGYGHGHGHGQQK